MKIFQLFQKYLAGVGVEPLQPFQKNHSVIMFLKRLLAFTVAITCIIFLTGFLGHEDETLDEYADSFFASLSLTMFSVNFAIFIWKMDGLFKLIEDFENLIRQRMENPESKSAYVKLNENIEKWTGVFHFITVKLTVTAMLMPNFIISFYLYFATDLRCEGFILPYQWWTPFYWRTPIGYLIIFTIQGSATYYAGHIVACSIGSLVSLCFMIFTFCNEIKSEIHALDERNKAGESPAELMKRVADIVEFHTKPKQLVFDMNNIYALIIIIYFLWSLVNICSTFLVVQMKLEQNVVPLELIKPLYQAFWSFSLLFLICEFGQRLTNLFDQLNDAIYDCDWAAFPRDIQKILPLIIQNTQRPVVLQTFENASCNRESFKQVANRGFSYFMMFRKSR